MPDETLGQIFDEAYAADPPKGPLSRRLRRFYDSAFFRSVTVQTEEQYRQLHELTTSRPAIGLCVRELVLIDTWFVRKPGSPRLDEVLADLPALRSLYVSSWALTWFEDISLRACEGKTALPDNLVSLQMAIPLGWEACCESTLMACAGLSKLKSLRLNFGNDNPDTFSAYARGFSPCHPASTEAFSRLARDVKNRLLPGNRFQRRLDLPFVPTPPALALPSVKDLKIGLPRREPALKPFLHCFPSLDAFEMESLHGDPDLAGALASVVNPAALSSLTIHARPWASWCFPDNLALLTSLQVIRLWGNFARVGFHALSRTPIKRFELAKDSSIETHALVDLLRGPHALPKLQVVLLDNLKASYPKDFDSEDVERLVSLCPTDEVEIRRLLSRFKTPLWTEDFSWQGFQQLERAIESSGVSAEGSTFEAANVYRHYLALRGTRQRPTSLRGLWT